MNLHQIIFPFVNLVSLVIGLTFQPGQVYVPEIESSVLELRNIIGTVYNKTFSSLNEVKLLAITLSAVDRIEDDALCASPFTKIEIFSNLKFPKLNSKQFGPCSSLKSLEIAKNINMEIANDTFATLHNLVKLKLRNVNLTVITRNYFKNLAILDVLVVSLCNVSTIENGTFDTLISLKYLDLSRNRIASVDGILPNLKTLQKLHLEYNNLTSFPWYDLKNLTNLVVLNVTQNQLPKYDVGKIAMVFPNLTVVHNQSQMLGNTTETEQEEVPIIELKVVNFERIYISSQIYVDYEEEEATITYVRIYI